MRLFPRAPWFTCTLFRTAIIDVEPVYTFRGHTGAVLSATLSTDGDVLYSGSTDGSIRLWQIPSDMTDPYDVYGNASSHGRRHCLSLQIRRCSAVCCTATTTPSGVSASMVPPVCWPPVAPTPPSSCGTRNSQSRWSGPSVPSKVGTRLRACVLHVGGVPGLGGPTSLDFVHNDLHHLAVSYTTSRCVLYDIETGQQVVNLDSAVTYGECHLSVPTVYCFTLDGTPNTQINKLVSHPTLPMILTAHEDKYIRFFDSKSGTCVHYAPRPWLKYICLL